MIIYLTTNLINDKKYIGKDIKNNPKYLGSGSLLKEDIKKYGRKNFKKEILEYCKSKHDLKEREEYWINYFKAVESDEFYNIRKNVLNWNDLCTENKKKYISKKISTSNKGKKLSEETKQKISQSNKGKCKGNYHTNESKEKISLSNKGRKHSKETKQKISQSLKGKKRSLETKTKQSQSRKNHPMYVDKVRNQKISQSLKGKKHSKETKEKIRQFFKNRDCSYNFKEVIQYDINGNLIQEYKSAKEAKHITGLKIQNALVGKAKHCGGYIWKYKNQ
jgi:group I intron endonuclease